jgi:hypothetical protein
LTYSGFWVVRVWPVGPWAPKCWRVTWPKTWERAIAAAAQSYQSICSSSASVSSGGMSGFGWRTDLVFGER